MNVDPEAVVYLPGRTAESASYGSGDRTLKTSKPYPSFGPFFKEGVIREPLIGWDSICGDRSTRSRCLMVFRRGGAPSESRQGQRLRIAFAQGIPRPGEEG